MKIGDHLFGGQLVVATVDPQGRVLSVTFPNLKSDIGQPLTVTYSYGVTEQFLIDTFHDVL